MVSAEAPTQEQPHPLLERLRARTAPVREAARGPAYNHPLQAFMRPDGDVVTLQGDPINFSYYTKKGYAPLSDEEVRVWREEVRPKTLAEQRARAGLITAIRRVASKFPLLEIQADLEYMSEPELRQMADQLGQQVGTAVTVITGPRRADPAPERDSSMGGIALSSGAELKDKMERAAASGRRNVSG